jgi:hypothetical protein
MKTFEPVPEDHVCVSSVEFGRYFAGNLVTRDRRYLMARVGICKECRSKWKQLAATLIKTGR